jgi:NAD(P)-dependent dehydrogenase (short-subunit alcohol dehydrogenase family)
MPVRVAARSQTGPAGAVGAADCCITPAACSRSAAMLSRSSCARVTSDTEEEYSSTTGVNLAGFFRTTQLVIPQMLTEGGGHIVNIPSVLASLTKGGVQSATKSLAIEYAARGIRANAVSPGIVKRSTTRCSAACSRSAGWASRATSSRR